MTTNQIDFDRVLQTVYAVSALGTLTGDPRRQCPPGNDEAEALLELTATEFAPSVKNSAHKPTMTPSNCLRPSTGNWSKR